MSFLATAYILPLARVESVCRAVEAPGGRDGRRHQALGAAASREIESDYQCAACSVVTAMTYLAARGIDFIGEGLRSPAARRLDTGGTSTTLVLTPESRAKLLPPLRATRISVPELVRHYVEMGGEEESDAADVMKAAVR